MQGRPHQMAKPLSWLLDTKKQWLYFKPPPDISAFQTMSKTQLSPPPLEPHFLLFWPCPLGHYLKLMTIDEGWCMSRPPTLHSAHKIADTNLSVDCQIC